MKKVLFPIILLFIAQIALTQPLGKFFYTDPEGSIIFISGNLPKDPESPQFYHVEVSITNTSTIPLDVSEMTLYAVDNTESVHVLKFKKFVANTPLEEAKIIYSDRDSGMVDFVVAPGHNIQLNYLSPIRGEECLFAAAQTNNSTMYFFPKKYGMNDLGDIIEKMIKEGYLKK